MLTVLNDEINSTSIVFGRGANKRSHKSMTEKDEDEDEHDSQNYGVTQQAEDANNTTNHVETTVMILYSVNKLYFGCYYDLSLCILELMEPIQSLNDDNEMVFLLLQQMNPERLICNSKVKFMIDKGPEKITEMVNIEVKTSKEFCYTEGNKFLDDLMRELNRKEETNDVIKLKDFLCSFNVLGEYKFYCSVLCAFSLNFDAINMGQNRMKKTDVIHAMYFVDVKNMLTVDIESRVSLGITNRQNNGKNNNVRKTIIELFGKTGSKIGNSLLSSYIMKPLVNLTEINERLDTVDKILYEMEINKKNSLVHQILDNIRGLSDISKLIHDLTIGNYKASIWRKLRNYLINVIKIGQYIESSSKLMECKVFQQFVNCLNPNSIQDIREKLEHVLDFDMDIDAVNIKDDLDQEFEDYKKEYDALEEILNSISQELTNSANIDIITAYIPQFGYLIAIEREELRGDETENLQIELIFQTSTTNYYKNDLMVEMDNKYGDLYSLIRDKEIEILYALKDAIIPDLKKLLISYSYIGHIDVLICFANVAVHNNFCKPYVIDEDNPVIEIVDSFHPLMDKNSFINNSFKFNESRMIVITGPNYSGKSTLLTQIGLTVYLAQIGCFIPASSGKLSIFKNILTRINTMDSINATQSTFMKDCQQMSKCLNKSTNKSLVLIDEFGKGTDINDGPGLLGGVIKHFLNRGDKCPMVLATTHLSEIFQDDLIGEYNQKIQFNHMKVMTDDEKNFKLTFLFEVGSGIASSSCGLYCARQCGVGIDIIEKAQQILDLINQGKDIANEFSILSDVELSQIKDSEERIKNFLKLDFQEWDDKDVKKLRDEVMKILE